MDPTAELLDQEWETIKSSTEARRAVRRWSLQHPVLRGAEDLEAVLARRRHPDLQRDVLTALARRAPVEPLAARALLQALLPGLLCLAAGVGSDDRYAIPRVISLAWERIRTYPQERLGSPAANIVWDVRKRYHKDRAAEDPTAIPLPAHRLPDADDLPDQVAVERSVFDRLAVAQRDGVISDAARRLIIRTRIHGDTLPTVAADEGETVDALNQRRWRAERDLRRWGILKEAS